ncbi:hypothetical protein BG003_001902 [Podila horticola]|nr:hypothetical protein BG003_001902 [Podila horticola]
MPIDPLKVPHILKAITDFLSFDDRLSCVPVSHAWNNTITPLFWEDVTTYRSQLIDDILPPLLSLAETATSNPVDSKFELIYFGIQVRTEIPRLILRMVA